MDATTLRQAIPVTLSTLVLVGAIVTARANHLIGSRPALAVPSASVAAPHDGCTHGYAHDVATNVIEPIVVCWDRDGYLGVVAPGR